MESLKGKSAIITGAGRGIGRAIAIALAAEGVNVGLISRSNNDLLKLKDELKTYAVKTAIAIADVADILAVNQAVNTIQKDLGPIDILINNAGIVKFGKFLELEPPEWEDQIKVNL